MNRVRSILRNPIIQRVRRHASISTLLPSSEPDLGIHSRRSVIYTPLISIADEHPAIPKRLDRQQADAPIQPTKQTGTVRQRLAAIFRKWRERRSPEKRATPIQEKPLAERASQPPVDPLKPEKITEDQTRLSETPGKVTGDVQPVITPASFNRRVSPALSQKPSLPRLQESEDHTWRRLQTIMRKHEEKQAGEQEIAAEELATENDHTPPHKVNTLTSPVKASGIQKSPLKPTSTRLPGGPASPVQNSGTLDSPSILENEAIQSQVIHADQPSETVQPQPVPLESVWPVQRWGADPLPTSRNAPPLDVPPPAHSMTPPVSAEEEQLLNQVVQRTKTSQPTDSHVEVILPREARPALPVKATPSHLPEASLTGNEIEKPASELNKLASDLASDRVQESQGPVDEGVASPTAEKHPAEITYRAEQSSSPMQSPVDSVQRQPQDESAVTTPRGSEKTSENYIQTEIGPLPDDLWGLLNLTPPGKPPVQTRQTRQQPGLVAPVAPLNGSTTVAPVQRFELQQPASMQGQPPVARNEQKVEKQPATVQVVHDQEGLAGAVPDQVQEVLPGIQRSPDTEQAPANSSSPVAMPEEGVEGKVSLSDSELDALARQVYAEIRHKLSIERERSRK